MAALGKVRGIIRRVLSAPAGATPESGALTNIKECLLFLLLTILVFHVYAHGKDGSFVYDDLVNIADNSHIRINSLDWESLKRAAFESPIPTRPVANISFALNYYFNQLEPRNFRLVNVLVHLGNGLLLLFLLKATLRTPILRQHQPRMTRFMPFAAVAIWIINPIHTQSVSYIVQRMNSMATFFYLLAFVFYIHARLTPNRRGRWLLFGGGGLAFLLAAGSKENTITLPFLIFLYEWYFFRDLDYGWLKKNLYWPLAILLFWGGMALFYLGLNPVDTIITGYNSRDFTLLQRIMTQSRVVIFYIFLFLFPLPARLNLDHYFPLSLSLFDPPTTLLSMLAILALFATAVLCARRERLLSFCILWFLGNLIIESSVLGLELLYEHRTYLPTILVSLVIVMFLYRSVPNVWARRAVLLMIMAVGTIWTHERNMVWADSVALWEDSVKKSPEKARPYVNLGLAYKESGQLEKAIHYLQQAVHLKPDYEKARYNLAISLLSRGDFRAAEHNARAALEKSPRDTDTLNTLGISLAQQGRFAEALPNFYRAEQLNPHDASIQFNLSLTLTGSGQIDEAYRHCWKALKIKPDYHAARIHLKEIRRLMRQIEPPAHKPFE